MKNENEIFESLILGGLIGAALGEMVSNNKKDGMGIGAIAGAAILATFKANENAQKTNVPVYIEEDGYIFEYTSNGQKRLVKTIAKSEKNIPSRFKLK